MKVQDTIPAIPEVELRTRIRNNFNLRRFQIKLTQEQAAGIMGISRQGLKYKLTKAPIEVESVRAMAAALYVSCEALCSGNPAKVTACEQPPEGWGEYVSEFTMKHLRPPMWSERWTGDEGVSGGGES